jgi:hypothetical protein
MITGNPVSFLQYAALKAAEVASLNVRQEMRFLLMLTACTIPGDTTTVFLGRVSLSLTQVAECKLSIR